jgi:hypothetical protein
MRRALMMLALLLTLMSASVEADDGKRYPINEVETPDAVAQRIERAAPCLGPERIVFVHPDCGLWMLPRSVADAKMRALVAGRDLFDHGGAA